MLTTAQVTKLAIDAYETIEYKAPPTSTWTAMLNPSELTYSRKNIYGMTQSVGTSAPQQSWVGGQPDEVSLSLLLDGTGAVGGQGSVLPRLEKLIDLTRFQSATHQPYYVHVYWGDFHFRGVLSQVDVKYTLFDREGHPVRAAVTLQFKEALSPEEVEAQDNPQSPDLYQTWLVREGERLDSIAESVYGDPAYWRPLAVANALVNPRGLRAGQILMLPPVAQRTGRRR